LASPLALIVGLGNPGSKYESTRHNVGFWLVEKIADTHAASFRSEAKFHGEACKITHADRQIWLLKPQTYMNNSGQSLAAMARFYKISPKEISRFLSRRP
jgi:PTH1 family peptidyl-tRNA hydrolase